MADLRPKLMRYIRHDAAPATPIKWRYTDTAGEECEPQTPGNCCTAACQFESAGAACASDGDLCANHTCDGAGICQHVEAPNPSCVAAAPRGSSIKILHASTARQKLGWSWKGAGVALSDLDDPTGIGSLPMSVDPTVSVELRNADGRCWGAEFSATKANDLATLKAKSD